MTITVDELTGYVARDLDADLARWFPGAEPADVGDEAKPVAPFLDRLPPAAAAALAAFDQRVRAKRIPETLDISDWSYAFDFAGNECGILDSDYETELTDDDVLTVLPATLGRDALVERLRMTDAAVIMKLGRHLPKVRAALAETGLLARAIYVERGTMPGEFVIPLGQKPDDAAPYFSMVLVPGEGRRP